MKKVLAMLFALSLLFLCSCGILPNNQNQAGSTSSSVGHALSGASSASESPSPSASASAKPSPSQAPSSPAPLDKTELAYFTDYFKDNQNNGFLLSSYSKVTDIDMKQLFYTGAGIAADRSSIPKEEQDAYLTATKQKELWGDLLKLTAKQLNDFLKEKTGLSYSDFTQELTWTYIDQYDAYYKQVSDTNFCQLAAVSGTKTSDGTYIIKCEKSGTYGQQIDSCVVTMKKVGDHYLFVSNNAHQTQY